MTILGLEKLKLEFSTGKQTVISFLFSFERSFEYISFQSQGIQFVFVV